MAGKKYQIDMCNGPLFSKIIIFSLPLIATAALQQLFSAADLVVVGRYSTYQDMAAVGSCLPVCSLIVNIFFGISVGAGVLTANGIGAKDKILTSRSIHTAMAFAGAGGVILMIVGLILSYPLLKLMDTPDDVMGKALWYMCIYCLGLPTLGIYAYGASLMRSMGDTRRPLYYLIFSGIINVVLNYILVAFFSLGVIGVAVATMVSFAISSLLIIRALMNLHGALKLKKNLLKIDWKILKNMLWIGLPAGLQGFCFAVSNFIIQGAINSFGSAAMAGNAAALNIETILYSACFSFNQAATSFAGQNMGAKKYHRVAKSAVYCIAASSVIEGVLGIICIIFGRQLLSIYNPDAAVVSWGMQRAIVVFGSYSLCAAMDSITGVLRGMGQSVGPMVVSIFGVCIVRMMWVWWVFPRNKTLLMLMISYPLSYVITIALTGIMLYYALKKYNAATDKYGSVAKA